MATGAVLRNLEDLNHRIELEGPEHMQLGASKRWFCMKICAYIRV